MANRSERERPVGGNRGGKPRVHRSRGDDTGTAGFGGGRLGYGATQQYRRHEGADYGGADLNFGPRRSLEPDAAEDNEESADDASPSSPGESLSGRNEGQSPTEQAATTEKAGSAGLRRTRPDRRVGTPETKPSPTPPDRASPGSSRHR